MPGDLRTTLSDYIAFIQKVCDDWLADAEHDPATVTAMNSSVSLTPTTVNYSHTIANLTGSQTVTEQQNLGVVSVTPSSASVGAAGGTGTAVALVAPTDTPVIAESSDASWLTASVAGTTVTWTAAANGTGASRSASIRLSTSPQSYAQALMITQAAT